MGRVCLAMNWRSGFLIENGGKQKSENTGRV